MAQKKASQSSDPDAPIVIKKYANRRLYNTVTSSYVTLDHLSQMVKDRIEFVVQDAKTGDDITRAVLTQIIVEEESKGQHLLPISFLRQLIGFYGDNLQGLVPQYLEMTMQSFTSNQDQIRKYLNDAFGGMYPFGQIEEMSRQNLAMFEKAVTMFSPLGADPEGGAKTRNGPVHDAEKAAPESAPPAGEPSTGEPTALNDLKSQLEAMQRQLDALSRGRDD